ELGAAGPCGPSSAGIASRIAEAALGARGIDLAAVEARPLGRIREQLVGLGGFPELLLDPLVGIDVGVQLLREPAIGALDLIRRGGTPQAQYLVGIFHHGPVGCAWFY